MARGDHIYVNRWGGVYSHHGIDCGGGSVIHLTTASWGPPGVRRDPIDVFAEGAPVQVRDYAHFFQAANQGEQRLRDTSLQVGRLLDAARGRTTATQDHTPDAVVARAESRLGEIGFDLLFQNCEHFATWCRTGISNSAQIDGLWKLSLSPPGYLWRRASRFLDGVFD